MKEHADRASAARRSVGGTVLLVTGDNLLPINYELDSINAGPLYFFYKGCQRFESHVRRTLNIGDSLATRDGTERLSNNFVDLRELDLTLTEIELTIGWNRNDNGINPNVIDAIFSSWAPYRRY
jgi:hypothetical protein